MPYQKGSPHDLLIPGWVVKTANFSASGTSSKESHYLVSAAGLTVTLPEVGSTTTYKEITVMCGVDNAGTIVARDSTDTITRGTTTGGVTVTNTSGKAGDFVMIKAGGAGLWTVVQQKGEWTIA